jgi:hypothetical protein
MRRASRRRVWFWILAGVVIAAALPRLYNTAYNTAVLGFGFLAQTMCGDVFISKRDPGEVLANDMNGPDYQLLKLFQPSVDRDRRLVAASAFGIGRQSPFSAMVLAAPMWSATARASFARKPQMCSTQLRKRQSDSLEPIPLAGGLLSFGA